MTCPLGRANPELIPTEGLHSLGEKPTQLPTSVSSDHKPAVMPGVGKHQSTCLPSAQVRVACGSWDTPGQKNPSKLLLLDVCGFVTAETRRAKGLVLKERREMLEPGCCQLTCHSLHTALGPTGWGEAGAGEPAQPQSHGRGSKQVGSCLTQAPRSCSVRHYLSVESARHFQPRVQGFSSPCDCHGSLCSGVGGEVVPNWKHSVRRSTGWQGWGADVWKSRVWMYWEGPTEQTVPPWGPGRNEQKAV